MKADVEGAKKLLAEAGYPNGGFKIEIKCSPQYPEFVATTLVIQESLKKLNVDVTVTQMEGAFVADNKKSNDSCGKESSDIYVRQHVPPRPGRLPLPLLPLEGGDQQGRLRHAGREARRPAGRGAPVEQPRGAEAALRGNPASCDAESLDWWWYAKYNIEATSNKLQGYSQSFTGRRLSSRRPARLKRRRARGCLPGEAALEAPAEATARLPQPSASLEARTMSANATCAG